MINRSLLLAVNGGSSTIKFGLYDSNRCINSGQIDRASDGGLVRDVLARAAPHGAIAAVGHRIVMGGAKFLEHQVLTPTVLDELRKLQPLDPEHLPNEIALIDAFQKELPDVPQVACFDSAFHRDLPTVAKMLPIPRKYFDAGIRRLGYHGLSFAYLLEDLARIDPSASNGKIILAHLGSGCSLAAVKDGKPIDTSMGFTPTGGVMMSTRAGDLDPGVFSHVGADELTRESGLLGISQITGDIRQLLAMRANDKRAADAVNLFCYIAKKWIGSFAAALGGLDTLIFSAGIGENSPVIREQICGGLEFLDLKIDPAHNDKNAAVISADSSRVKVRIIKTDEQQMIARIVGRIVKKD